MRTRIVRGTPVHRQTRHSVRLVSPACHRQSRLSPEVQGSCEPPVPRSGGRAKHRRGEPSGERATGRIDFKFPGQGGRP